MLFMKNYIEEPLTSFGEALDAKVSPRAKKSFKNINENSQILDKQESETLHYIVAKLLWAAKRGRPKIEPAIKFICTRVTKSTVEDKTKLKCVLKFAEIDNKR